MGYDSEFKYWMDDDDGGYSDDSGDDGYGDDDQSDDTGQDDDDNPSDGDDEDQVGDGGGDDTGGGNDGGNDGGDGNGGDGDVDDEFSDPNDLLPLDDDVALSTGNFPNATDADFVSDDGNWTPDDYQQSAANLFGDHEYFGDTMTTQRVDEGYQPFGDPGFMQGFEEVAPGSSETVQLFERDGHLSAFGFISMAMLEYLRMRYTGIDLSNLDVTVPPRGEPVQPQPLPPAFDSVQPAPAVDLRKYCTPVGDQEQTARCSAFAWTHATELVANIKGGSSPRLSPSYTMLEFQRMQGDAQDYSYAYSGGDGTVSGNRSRPGCWWKTAPAVRSCGRTRCKSRRRRSGYSSPMRKSITSTVPRIRLRSMTSKKCSARVVPSTWRSTLDRHSRKSAGMECSARQSLPADGTVATPC